jgi:hypothetical protein
MASAITPAQHNAMNRAKAAFARLPQENTTFQECIVSHETVHKVLENICADGRIYKRKRSTRLLESFERHTSWMMNISGAVDVAVQTSAGIACPMWAPIKFVLKVCSIPLAYLVDHRLSLLGISRPCPSSRESSQHCGGAFRQPPSLGTLCAPA